MKQQSQSNELTGSLVASDSATNVITPQTETTTTPPARDFMYNWIREKSGRVKLD
jgi:hypothetical protein